MNSEVEIILFILDMKEMLSLNITMYALQAKNGYIISGIDKYSNVKFSMILKVNTNL